MHIRFLGAAGEVTGSRYLVEASVRHQPQHFLVECGMFQGGRDASDKNLARFPIDPATLGFVILTHAHIDHSGWLPRLCAQGFKKKVYCTPGTFELLKVLLMDSAHIQNANLLRAEKRAKAGRWRGEIPQPLYTTEDVTQCLSQIETVEYEKPFAAAAGITCFFRDAGHILGAAIAVIDCEDDDALGSKAAKRIVFSGDLGTRDRPLMHDPKQVESADVLVVESTYGDRLHRSLKETEDELVETILSSIKRGGNIVMPAFAVGRTQEVVYLLLDLVRRQRLPFLSIFVDSPMATAASHITTRFLKALDAGSQTLNTWFQQHPDAVHLRFTADVNESKALNLIKSGAIIISASGMCEAGRVLHHLAENLPRSQCSIIITGFQAAGTRGRELVDGATTVRIMGQDVMVKATIHTLGGLSAHADQADLLWWLRGFESAPQKVFIVHGEPKSSENLATVIRDELGWPHVTLPQRGTLHPC